MIKKIHIFSLLLLAALFGCKKGGNTNTPAGGSAQTVGPDMYITASRLQTIPGAPFQFTTMYWKNGQKPLVANMGGALDGYPTGVAKIGTNIFILGYLGAANTVYKTPVYWENDNVWQQYEASAATFLSMGNNVIVGNDIYIVGSKYSNVFTGQAFYWKNWNEVPLPTPTGNIGAIANSMAISGNDIYACGLVFNNGTVFNTIKATAAYWKNGQVITLDNGFQNSAYTSTAGENASGIAVSGSDVYVCGLTTNASGSTSTGYWKNRQWVTLLTLPAGSYMSVTGIAVSGNDVYVCGSLPTGNAVYWKNGQQTILTTNNTSSASGITISGNDVYVWGTNGNSLTYNNPGYWKNGQWVALPPLNDGVVTGVYTITSMSFQ